MGFTALKHPSIRIITVARAPKALTQNLQTKPTHPTLNLMRSDTSLRLRFPGSSPRSPSHDSKGHKGWVAMANGSLSKVYKRIMSRYA